MPASGSASRTDCTAVLAELCRLTPNNMALVSLELKPVDVTVEEETRGRNTSDHVRRGSGRRQSNKKVRRVQLVICGLAPGDVEVANFIGQLSASPLFQDVNMGYARTRELQDRIAREFQASCYLIK